MATRTPRRTSSTRSERADSGREATVVVSCGGGTHAYVHRAPGQGVGHHRTDSEAFEEALRSMAGTARGARARADIEALSVAMPRSPWPTVRDRLERRGVWGPA